MAIAATFVLLSQWQFSRSQNSAPPPPSTTEQVKPLVEVFEPGVPMMATVADQVVSVDGEFLPDTRVLVQNRLQDDRDGFWVVSAFQVNEADGVGQGAVLPVVHGWVPDSASLERLADLQGAAEVMGRLLPSEAPEAQRPVQGEVPTLSTAELINRWDVPEIYSGFVVSFETSQGGQPVALEAPLEPVSVGPQPQDTPLNWLNIFYAVEWFVFAGFAFFLWWRLVADDHRRQQEDLEDAQADIQTPNDEVRT